MRFECISSPMTLTNSIFFGGGTVCLSSHAIIVLNESILS